MKTMLEQLDARILSMAMNQAKKRLGDFREAMCELAEEHFGLPDTVPDYDSSPDAIKALVTGAWGEDNGVLEARLREHIVTALTEKVARQFVEGVSLEGK